MTEYCKSVLYCREFVEKSFSFVGINILWEGKGIDEVGKDEKTGIVRFEITTKFVVRILFLTEIY